MGVFLNGVLGESTGYGAIRVPEVEGYNGCHELAALQIQHENMANDLAIFKSALISDVRENQMIQEGVSEEEVLTESFETAKGVLNKLKEMLLKLLAKIKAIISAFIAKLSGLSSDYKALFDKYKKVIAGHTDWKKFKIKYQPINDVNGSLAMTLTFPVITNSGELPNEYASSNDEIPDDDEVEEKVLKALLPAKLKDVSAIKDLKKEMHDLFFDTEELIDGDSDNISGSDIIKMCEEMPNLKKLIDGIVKLNTSLETNIKKRISDLGKMQSKVIDVAVSRDSSNKTTDSTVSQTEFVGKNKYKTDTRSNSKYPFNKDFVESRDVIKNIGILQKFVNCEQRLVTAFNTCFLADVKFFANQIKRIWTSAAAFASLRKENQELYSLMGEISLQENNDYFTSEAV
jgi:hypothetical protein